MTTNTFRLATGVAVAVGLAVVGTWTWQEFTRQTEERASLEREFATLRAETEETASWLGLQTQLKRPSTQPNSEVLRLRGEISRLARELKDLQASWPADSVSSDNRAKRDQIVLQATKQFEARERVRTGQLSSVLQVLNQVALQPADFAFLEPDGKLAPGLAQLFPGISWDEIEIQCHDSKTLRFLQSRHPEAVVVSFSQPLLDPAGERVRTGIRANGEILSAPEASFQVHLRSGLGNRADDEAALSREWKQFQEGR